MGEMNRVTASVVFQIIISVAFLSSSGLKSNAADSGIENARVRGGCLASTDVRESSGKRELNETELLECIRCEDKRQISNELLTMLRKKGLNKDRILITFARIGDENSIPSLLEFLKNEPGQLNNVCWSLGEIESENGLDLLKNTLRSGDSSSRAVAVEAIGKILANKLSAKKLGIRKSELVQLISKSIDESSDSQNSYELIAKGMIAILRSSDSTGLDSVAKQLKSADGRLRWQAANVLARSKQDLTPYLAFLRENLKDIESEATVIYAARALGSAKDSAAVDSLLGLLNRTNSYIAQSSVTALGAIGDKRAVSSLLKYGNAKLNLYNEALVKKVRIPSEQNDLLILATALGSIKDSSSLPFLQQLRALTVAKQLQAEIEIAIAKFGEDAFFDKNAEESITNNWQSEAAFAQGLAELKTDKAKSKLLEMWRLNKDERSRVEILNAIAATNANGKTEILLESLKNPDAIVKSTAAGLLAEAGDASAEILSALREAFKASRKDKINDARLSLLEAANQLKHPFNEEVLSDKNETDYLVKKKALELARLANPSSYAHYELGPADSSHTEAYYKRVVNQAMKGSPAKAVIKTEKGDIELSLFTNLAPMNADNFISLAKSGYFNKDISFMRVVPNFVVQSGDPRNDMNGGPGYQIRCEINKAEYDKPGVLGMALSGKDTGGSQFFITHSAQPHLDGSYTVFGQVSSGVDVVNNIARGDRVLEVIIEP